MDPSEILMLMLLRHFFVQTPYTFVVLDFSLLDVYMLLYHQVENVTGASCQKIKECVIGTVSTLSIKGNHTLGLVSKSRIIHSIFIRKMIKVNII